MSTKQKPAKIAELSVIKCIGFDLVRWHSSVKVFYDIWESSNKSSFHRNGEVVHLIDLLKNRIGFSALSKNHVTALNL